MNNQKLKTNKETFVITHMLMLIFPLLLYSLQQTSIHFQDAWNSHPGSTWIMVFRVQLALCRIFMSYLMMRWSSLGWKGSTTMQMAVGLCQAVHGWYFEWGSLTDKGHKVVQSLNNTGLLILQLNNFFITLLNF